MIGAALRELNLTARSWGIHRGAVYCQHAEQTRSGDHFDAVLLCECQAEGNPYRDIAARNVFGLKDPPPPAPFPPPAPPKPPAKLVLTGVADFSTAKWAFVTRADPGRPPKSYTLSFGETEGGLQLVGIDARAATATVLVDGSDLVTLQLVAATNPPSKAVPPAHLSAMQRSRLSHRQ